LALSLSHITYTERRQKVIAGMEKLHDSMIANLQWLYQINYSLSANEIKQESSADWNLIKKICS
jgi:hypothetical protein